MLDIAGVHKMVYIRIVCIFKVPHVIVLHFRYLKYHKRCLNDRKKLGIGCSEVNIIS